MLKIQFLASRKKTNFSIILVVFLIMQQIISFGTVGQGIKDQKLSLECQNETLKSVMSKIEKKTKLKFVYNPNEIKINRKLSISLKEETITQVLTSVFSPLQINFEIISEKQVILSTYINPLTPKPVGSVSGFGDSPKRLIAIPIKGTIKDEKGEPVVGVSVRIKGSTQGTISNGEGKYSISIEDQNSILVFSIIGYTSIEVLVGNQTIVDVVLADDEKLLNEVVVVGYATTNRKDILGSVASIKEQQIIQTTPVNAFDAIQGRLAGVQINSLGGPGEGSSIKIRGVSTFEGGSNPLYIVDGQQLEDINNLNPNDIASMEILKDGASAAIYGSKSANGVVIITTKTGKSEAIKIDVDYNHVINTLASNVPLSNARQRVIYENLRAGRDPDAQAFNDSLSILYQYSPDIQAFMYGPSSRDQLNVSVSSAKQGLNFYWNNSFLNEEGTIINTSYRRFSTRLKITSDVKKRISAGTTLNMSYEKQTGLNEDAVFTHLLAYIPYYPLFEPDGSFTPEFGGRQNPVAEAQAAVRQNDNYRFQNLSFLQLNLAKGLTFKSILGVNFRFRKDFAFDPLIVVTPPNLANGFESNALSYDYQQENFFTYRKKVKGHNFTGILGNQTQVWNLETTDIRATAFNSDNIRTFNNVALLDLARTNTDKSKHALTGYFGSLSYDYKGKYLINGTLRRDGSSRFGADNRYGWFPSASIGWRVSGEDFMKGTENVIDNLLLKASFGTNGNERIGDYNSQLLYSPGAFYNGVNTVNIVQLSNPFLGWESTQSTNLGIVASMLKSRINLEVDFWRKLTSGLLYNVPLPRESGFNSVRQNIGSIQNEGIDISLGGLVLRKKDFEWNANFNVTFLRNKVVELANGTSFEAGAFLVEEGQPLGNMYGFKNNGVFPYNESNAFANDGTQLTPVFNDAGIFSNYTLNGVEYTGTVNRLRVGNNVLRGGDIWWADLNNDFAIDGQNDRTLIGNGTPKYFGGFNNDFRYKGISLSILFDYNFGNNIYRQYDFLRNDLNSAGETPSPDRIEESWRNPGDIKPFATLNRSRTNNALGPNSQYVSKGDYIRLRSLRFSYALPNTMFKKINWLSNASINFTINNLFTLTNYPGYSADLGSNNPLQVGFDTLKYPNRRDFILGIRFQL